MRHAMSRRRAVCLFAVVVLAWGVTWPVTKVIVESVPPTWTTALRSAIATVVLFALLLFRGQLVVPRRGDLPVVLAVSLLHMVAFATLIAVGLQYVPVGRSVVLGYTTPLWVVPGARLFLREPMRRRQGAGVGLGLAGLAVMFNPVGFDWSDGRALFGNAMLLLAALCWAVSILYVRAHVWISTPFQLVFWQSLLATAVLSALALALDGPPRIAWTPGLVAGFLYAGVLGSALAYWAMTMVNRSLPAVTTSLGILATPVVGIATSLVFLGEGFDGTLVLAMAMILGGIAVGTVPEGWLRPGRLCAPRKPRTIDAAQCGSGE